MSDRPRKEDEAGDSDTERRELERVDIVDDDSRQRGAHTENNRANGGEGDADRSAVHKPRSTGWTMQTLPDGQPGGASEAVLSRRRITLTVVTL